MTRLQKLYRLLRRYLPKDYARHEAIRISATMDRVDAKYT